MIKPRVQKNYLNNKDILKEIHLSKISYCSFRDRDADHWPDIILETMEEITEENIQKAKQRKVDRAKKEFGEILDIDSISNTDLVIRVTCWDHIPLAPAKVSKNKPKKKAKVELMDLAFDVSEVFDAADDDIPVLSTKYVRLNFVPFYHYRFDENGQLYVVGKSHWKGDLENGEFCKEHGRISDNLARMYIMLCDRYASKGNWRGYTYLDEMKSHALLQLTLAGLTFNEGRSDNPFAYYTCCMTNAFRVVLNNERRSQNIRDDLLEMHGLDPSWTRQIKGEFEVEEARFLESVKNS